MLVAVATACGAADHGSGCFAVVFKFAAGALGPVAACPCSEALESAYLVAFIPDDAAGAVGGGDLADLVVFVEEHLRDLTVAAAWADAVPCKIN